MNDLPEWLRVSIFAITQVILLVGLFGLIVPLFPGILVMWLAVLVYGLIAGFGTLGTILFVIITLLMLAGTVVDNLFMGAGARKGGASWSTILAAEVAGIVGTIVFPPVGGLIASPLVVLLLEYRRTGDMNLAWLSLKGMAAGWGLSFIARFGIGLVMMILWWLWVWQG